MPIVTKSCLTCNKSFTKYEQPLRPMKYCSQSCFGKANRPKGTAPWNKGIKGLHFSPSTEFKKGVTPKNSMVFQPREHKFKGSVKEYKALHHRINRMFGKPLKCEKCNTDGLYGRQIHWANKSGKYVIAREDWIRLCVKCHYYFDNQNVRKARA